MDLQIINTNHIIGFDAIETQNAVNFYNFQFDYAHYNDYDCVNENGDYVKRNDYDYEQVEISVQNIPQHAMQNTLQNKIQNTSQDDIADIERFFEPGNIHCNSLKDRDFMNKAFYVLQKENYCELKNIFRFKGSINTAGFCKESTNPDIAFYFYSQNLNDDDMQFFASSIEKIPPFDRVCLDISNNPKISTKEIIHAISILSEKNHVSTIELNISHNFLNNEKIKEIFTNIANSNISKMEINISGNKLNKKNIENLNKILIKNREYSTDYRYKNNSPTIRVISDSNLFEYWI